MAVERKILLSGFLITTLIFIAILFFNSLVNDEREDVVLERMDKIVEEYEEMQSLLFMTEFFGEESTCVALSSMLSSMNKGLWELGVKIDSYRQVTEEFMKDPFYLDQKRKFNRREVLYFSMFKKMKEMCKINQTIVSYFYRKKDFCPDCDAQSFVLGDIKRDLENKKKDDQLAVFSFDADLDLSSINLLTKVYNVTSYPCMVVENNTYCGLYDKDSIIEILCGYNDLALCPEKS